MQETMSFWGRGIQIQMKGKKWGERKDDEEEERSPMLCCVVLGGLVMFLCGDVKEKEKEKKREKSTPNP